MEGIDLKSCPFCGGEDELRFEDPKLCEDGFRQYSLRANVCVKCKKCHFKTETYNGFVDLNIEKMELAGSFLESRAVKHVINRWNRRANE